MQGGPARAAEGRRHRVGRTTVRAYAIGACPAVHWVQFASSIERREAGRAVSRGSLIGLLTPWLPSGFTCMA